MQGWRDFAENNHFPDMHKTAIKIPGKRTRDTTKAAVIARKALASIPILSAHYVYINLATESSSRSPSQNENLQERWWCPRTSWQKTQETIFEEYQIKKKDVEFRKVAHRIAPDCFPLLLEPWPAES